jgi:hypothetical protein
MYVLHKANIWAKSTPEIGQTFPQIDHMDFFVFKLYYHYYISWFKAINHHLLTSFLNAAYETFVQVDLHVISFFWCII